MDDLLLIDCVERIRGHLLATDAALSRRLEVLRSLSPRTVDTRAAAEKCFALAAGMDPETPDGRREAAMAMVREAADPPPRALAPRGLPEREAEGRAGELLAWLVGEPPLADAVARVRRVYPGLRAGVRAHEFLAVVTGRAFGEWRTPLDLALETLHAWLAHPGCRPIGETARHAEILGALASRAGSTGGAIHDARIAAICIEHAVEEFWTADRDFSRYPDLRTRNPLIPTLHEPAPARR